MELVIAAPRRRPDPRPTGRILFRPNGITFEDLLRRTDLDWPRGVQEEEPVRWHTERLDRGPADHADRPIS